MVAVSFDTEDVPFGFLVGLVKEIEEEEEEPENEVEEESVAKGMVKVHWYSPHSQTKPNPRGKWTPDMVKSIGASKKLVPREDTIPRSSIPVKLKWQKQGFQEGKGGWIMPTSFRQVEDFVERDLAQLARWQLNEEAPDGGGGGDTGGDDLGAVAGEGKASVARPRNKVPLLYLCAGLAVVCSEPLLGALSLVGEPTLASFPFGFFVFSSLFSIFFRGPVPNLYFCARVKGNPTEWV